MSTVHGPEVRRGPVLEVWLEANPAITGCLARPALQSARRTDEQELGRYVTATSALFWSDPLARVTGGLSMGPSSLMYGIEATACPVCEASAIHSLAHANASRYTWHPKLVIEQDPQSEDDAPFLTDDEWEAWLDAALAQPSVATAVDAPLPDTRRLESPITLADLGISGSTMRRRRTP